MKIPEDIQKIKKEKYVNKKGSESEMVHCLLCSMDYPYK